MIARNADSASKSGITIARPANYFCPRYFTRPIAYFTYIYTAMIAKK